MSVPSNYVYDRPVDQISVWEIGPLLVGTAGNSLFLFLRHTKTNVATKGYFGKVLGLHIILYLHTAQILSVRPPPFTIAVGHTECHSLELKPLLLLSPMTFENTNCKLKVRSHTAFGHVGFNTGRDGSRGLHQSSMKMWNTFR